MVEVRALPYLAFFLVIDLLLSMSQVSIGHIQQTTGGNGTFYTGAGSYLNQENKNNYIMNTTIQPDLPNTAQGEASQGTFLFSDTWNAFKSFFTGIGAGAKIFLNMLFGIYNMLISFGIPQEFAYLIGTVWHLLTLFAFIVFFRGY